MKIHLLLLTLASLSAFSLHGGVRSGEPAPDFSLIDTTGTEHSLSDFAGKYVVLEWTNQSCPFVKKFYSEGHMQSLQKDMKDKGVVWLQIISSAPGKQGYLTAAQGEVMREEKKMQSAALLLDSSGEVGRLYGARATPHMYLIDPAGTLIYQGAIDSKRSTNPADIDGATNYVVEAYESAVAGKPIPNPTTKAYGCGIKY